MVGIFQVSLATLLLAFSPALNAQELTVQIQPQDQTEIQQAIDRLPSSGGKVMLIGGKIVVNISETIVIDRDNVTLEGDGLIELRLADAANKPVIVMGQTRAVPTVTRTNIHVRNLFINGNRANQSSEYAAAIPELRNNGISLRRVEDCSVERVTAYACRSGGLVTELGCRRVTVREFESYDNHFDGVACYETEDSLFALLKLHDNLAAGLSLDIDFVRNTVSDSLLASNRSVGIFMRDARDNVFTHLRVRDSGQHGVFIAQVENDLPTAATGNTFIGCTIANSGGVGLRVNDVSCAKNFLCATAFANNAGGDFTEAAPGLLIPCTSPRADAGGN